MLTTVLAILFFVLAALLAYITMQPDEMVVTREMQINAPPGDVFPHVNNLGKWGAWSPWEKRDPNIKITLSGSEEGEGAAYHWIGNKDVGEGKMNIVESIPNEKVVINLEFIKPFRATNTTEFTFTPQDEGTLVTWKMTGKNPFMAKAFSLFMDMDKMIGNDFIEGLTSLKELTGKNAGKA